MSKNEETLERLVSQGKCSCLNAKDYQKELRQLAQKEADPKEATNKGRFFKALGDATRQRLIGLLMSREMCVCELKIALNMTQPTTSHHLSILEESGIISGIKEGKWVYYKIRDKEKVATLLKNST